MSEEYNRWKKSATQKKSFHSTPLQIVWTHESSKRRSAELVPHYVECERTTKRFPRVTKLMFCLGGNLEGGPRVNCQCSLSKCGLGSLEQNNGKKPQSLVVCCLYTPRKKYEDYCPEIAESPTNHHRFGIIRIDSFRSVFHRQIAS